MLTTNCFVHAVVRGRFRRGGGGGGHTDDEENIQMKTKCERKIGVKKKCM